MKNTQNDQKWKKIETFLAVIPVCRVNLEHLKMLTLEKISQSNDLTVQLQTIEIEEQIKLKEKQANNNYKSRNLNRKLTNTK